MGKALLYIITAIVCVWVFEFSPLSKVIDLLADWLLDLFFGKKLRDSNYIGHIGEIRTGFVLKISKLFGIKGKILKNVYIPKQNGETAEIDLLFITDMGILVVESKNYSGWIFGNEKDSYWTATLQKNVKNRFFNPVIQNKGHIKALKNVVTKDIPIFSLVVFSKRCELKKVTVTVEDVYVVKRDILLLTLGEIRRKHPNNILSESDIEEIYKKLSVYAKADSKTKSKHIENISANYLPEQKSKSESINEEISNATSITEPISVESVQSETITEDNLICPKCGSLLVLRKAKRGTKSGDLFYGCSNYPKCRYSQSLRTETDYTFPDMEEPVSDNTETKADTDIIKEVSEAKEEKPVICPRCGGQLVLRTAKKGENAGKSFYGCSNYPKCRYIQSTEKEKE